MYLSKGHLCLVSNTNAPNVGPQVIYSERFVLALPKPFQLQTLAAWPLYSFRFHLRGSPEGEGYRGACEHPVGTAESGAGVTATAMLIKPAHSSMAQPGLASLPPWDFRSTQHIPMRLLLGPGAASTEHLSRRWLLNNGELGMQRPKNRQMVGVSAGEPPEVCSLERQVGFPWRGEALRSQL